jgi:DNA-binding SARP family transcriptional activator
MEFGLLGPLRVRNQEASTLIPSGRQRTVLAILLLNANRALPPDRIADLLLDGVPPENARTALRTYVMRLRRALGDELGRRIVTRPQGYLLEVDDGDVDFLQFTSLHRSARSATRAKAWPEADGKLREALSLWRGEPLVDVSSELLREDHVAHLELLRVDCLELHYEAQLELGGHEDIVLDLERSVVEFPLHERFRAQLMLALHRAGRKGDALRAFERAREDVVEKFGLDPGPELQELHQAILTDTLPAAVTSPQAPVAVTVPRQLPSAPDFFAGRAAEQRSLNQTLAEVRRGAGATTVAAIVGVGGIGKTALAVTWAHQVAELFPDGHLFANLRGYDPVGLPVQPSTVVRDFLDALAVPKDRIPDGPEAQFALYRSLLYDKRMLIVLDNARDAEHLRPLLPGSPSCMMLVTSRSKLDGLMVTHGTRVLHLDVMDTDEAISLVEQLLGPKRIAAEPEAATELVTLCGRIPLTTRVVAAQAAIQPDLSVRELLSRLQSIPEQLSRFETGEVATSIRAVMLGTYRHLDSLAAQLLRFLGLHRGSHCTLRAAASLMGVAVGTAQRALSELVRHHLVMTEGSGRYTMHDMIRAFAVERAHLDESETDRLAATSRLVDYCLHTADGAMQQIGGVLGLSVVPPLPADVTPETFADPTQAASWVEANRDTVVATLVHGHEEQPGARIWLTTERVSEFFNRQGHWFDWATAARCAITAATDQGDLTGQAIGYLELGRALNLLDTGEQALPCLRRAQEIYEQLDDRLGQARAHVSLTWFFGGRNRAVECRDHARRALDLYHLAEHPEGQAEVLNVLGWYSVSFGDHRAAIDACQQALAIYQEHGDRKGEAAACDSLAHAYERSGDTTRALQYYRRAISLDDGLDRLANRYYQADTLLRFGDLNRTVGDGETALGAWQRALDILEDIGHPEAVQVRERMHDAWSEMTMRA